MKRWTREAQIAAGWLALAITLYIFLQREDFKAYFDRPSRAATLVFFPQEEIGESVTVEAKTIHRRSSSYVLPPRSNGSLIFEIAKPADYLLDLWPGIPVEAPNEFSLEYRTNLSKDFRTILSGTSMSWGNLLRVLPDEIVTEMRRASRIDLRLTASNQTDREISVLNSLRVRIHEPIREDYYVFPGLLSVLGLLAAALALAWLLSDSTSRARTLAIVGAIVTCALLAWVSRSASSFSVGPDFRNLKWAINAFALVLSLTGRISIRGFLLITTPIWMAFSSTVFWDASANNFAGYLHESHDTWTHHARSMRLFATDMGFFSGRFGEREPFYVFLVHVFGKLFGETNFSHLNLVLFLLTFGAAFCYVAAGLLIGRAWITLLLAPAICFLYSHAEIIEDFQREAFSFTWLALLTLALFYRSEGPVTVRQRGPFIAVVLGILILTRDSFLSSVFVMTIVAAFLWALARLLRWRPPHLYTWSAVVLILAVPLILQAPIKANQTRMFGTSSYFLDKYARWNANVEFPERFGTPGFPTREEVLQINNYAGPRISYFDYLTKLRTPSELIAMNLEGLREVYKQHAAYVLRAVGVSGVAWIWLLLSALVICGVWVSRRQRSWVLFWLLIWYLAQNAYTFHLYRRPGLLIGARHVDHAVFTFLVLVGLTARKTTDELWGLLSPWFKIWRARRSLKSAS